MADQEQLKILAEGVERWNAWRREHPDIEIDLSRAHLFGIILRSINFRRANLFGADLFGANLTRADLYGANLSRANLNRTDLGMADLNKADLSGANFSEADLTGADLYGADLSYANLKDANLAYARCVHTNFSNASLEGCWVYGVSAWALKLDGANQKNLTITPLGEPAITVDDLEVAQFIYLMLNNEKVRRVIDTITTKVVLILGRFTDERKAILEAVREELRRQDYLPIMFDFDPAATRDLTETVSTLAHMARFIIADITDARSIPQELQAIVPHLPSVPVQPLLHASQHEYGMFEHFKRYQWVLPAHVYESSERLIAELREKVIDPAEEQAKKLRP